MILLISLLFPVLTFAQVALDLATNTNVTLDPKKQYLFVQDGCEACEKALLNLSICNDKIKKSFSIIAMESEDWAKKSYASQLIKKIQPQNFYLMSFVEAKKMKVFGTPTYWPNIDKKLRPRTCEQLKKEMKL
jgi:hypothetical protein